MEIVMGLDISDYEMIQNAMIDGEVAALLPKWRSNPSMDDGNDDKTPNASKSPDGITCWTNTSHLAERLLYCSYMKTTLAYSWSNCMTYFFLDPIFDLAT
jgi:hypothetical protein